jgi:hypothetical protein
MSKQNLDVSETSQDQVHQAPEGSAECLASQPHISVVVQAPAATASVVPRQYRLDGSRCLSLSHASNLIEAVDYARDIGRPLVAHATIHWSGTIAFDDHDGKRFAKVREGLHKCFLRRGIPGGLTAAWCRECKAHTDVVHCHLLFHLPAAHRMETKLLQIEAALYRLVARHGDGILGEFAVKLTIHPDPDGLYLIKGGNREVWEKFKIRTAWRQSQGVIYGKRCGTTENVG